MAKMKKASRTMIVANNTSKTSINEEIRQEMYRSGELKKIQRHRNATYVKLRLLGSVR